MGAIHNAIFCPEIFCIYNLMIKKAKDSVTWPQPNYPHMFWHRFKEFGNMFKY